MVLFILCNVVNVITLLAGRPLQNYFLLILNYSLKIHKNHVPKIHIDENMTKILLNNLFSNLFRSVLHYVNVLSSAPSTDNLQFHNCYCTVSFIFQLLISGSIFQLKYYFEICSLK